GERGEAMVSVGGGVGEIEVAVGVMVIHHISSICKRDIASKFDFRRCFNLRFKCVRLTDGRLTLFSFRDKWIRIFKKKSKKKAKDKQIQARVERQ
ncbi:hypothetical protein Tco_0851772, partial [Tanacetum coccineum]